MDLLFLCGIVLLPGLTGRNGVHMKLNYKIITKQGGVRKEYIGTVADHNDFQAELQRVYETFIKGEKAEVEISYKEESDEQRAIEREKISEIVKEEYDKMKANGEI